MGRTYGKDSSIGVARIDNLVVYLEREIPEAEPHLGWLDQALTEAVRVHGSRAAHLHVVELEGRSNGMREGPRSELTSMARRYDGQLGGAAFVVPRAGFGASVVRSVITGVLLVVRPRSPTKSFVGPAFTADTRIGSKPVAARRKTLAAVYPTAEVSPRSVPQNAAYRVLRTASEPELSRDSIGPF